MPGNTTRPPIIDLTDIVEQKASASLAHRTEEEVLSGHVSDLMKSDGPGEDIELDDLLAQLNEGEEHRAPFSAPTVNPNERLNMPGMDDMDAMFREFGSPPSDGDPDIGTVSEAGAGKPSADLELDDLLAGLEDKPAPAKAKTAADAELDDLLADLDGAEKKPAKAAQASPEDDLDALLGDLMDKPALAKAARPALEDLDALLDDLDKPMPGKAAQLAPDGLDALLDELDKPAPAKTAQPAPDDDLDALLGDLDKPAPAVTPLADDKSDELLNNLLDGLDVPPSGPVDRPVGGAADVDISQLDELLDSAAGAAKAAIASDAAGALETGLALELREAVEQLRERLEHTASEVLEAREEQEQLRQALEAVREDGASEALWVDMPARLEAVGEEQAQLRQTVDGLRVASTETTADILTRLEAVEEHFAGIAEELSSLRERLIGLEADLDARNEAPAALSQEQLDGVVEHVLNAMRAEIEKAAAASAAKVIREEINALFAGS